MPDRDLRVALRLRAQWEGRQVDRGVRRLRRGIDSVSDGLRRMESRATSALLAFGGVEALRRPIAAAVREFSNVETALVGVAKTADLGAAELARLDERITGLSLTPEVGQTRVALLEIAQTAGQLGVKGVDDLTRFTETIAKLEGASSDLGGAEAATALARILGVTGESIGTVDRFGSVIARLGNTFKATEGEIVHAGTRVATTLSSLYGVSAREAVALGTALRDLGLRAEVGATGLGQAFKRITDAARQGGEAGRVLERTLGQSLDRLRARIAEGDTLGVFTDFLAGLRDAGDDAPEILAALQLDAIESSQAIGTLFRNVDQVRDILDAANDEWRENTALTQEALRAAGTFSRQMQLVSNEIDASAAALGRRLAPALLTVAQHWQALGGAAGLVAGQLATHAARRVNAARRTLAEERRASIERTRQNLKEAVSRRARATAHAQDAARELAAVRATTVARTQLGSLIDRDRRSQARLAGAARHLRTAQRDLAVATSVAARAQTAHNIALRRGRTLMRVARGALGAMGGGIGLLTTALAAGVGWWLTWASTAKRAVDDVDQALKDGARALIEAGQSPLSSIDGRIAAFESRLETIDADIRVARRHVERNLPRSQTLGGVRIPSGREASRDLADLLSRRAELDRLLADLRVRREEVKKEQERINATADAGGDAGVAAGGDPAEALARIRESILDAAAGRRGALAALNREERKELAALDALRGQQGVDEKERLDTRIHILEEYQARRGDLRERLRAEELQADERQAGAQRAAIEEEHEQALAAAQRIEDARRTAEQGLAGISLELAGPFERELARIEAGGDRIRAALDDWGAGEERYTELSAALARQRAAAADREAARRLAASRRWQDGVKRGLDRIREETTNYAGIAERAVVGAFQSMGDGIEELVRTGKLRFGSLVEDILAGLARIAVQRAALGLFDLSPLGGRSGLYGIGTGNVHMPPAAVGHAGGIAGAASAVRRHGVPARVWRDAPRLHSGGLAADEVPAVLRRGEGVFTPEQMRALAPAAPPQVHIEIVNRGTPQRQAAPVRQRWDGRGWVTGVVLDDIDRNGPIAQAIGQRRR